MKNNLVDLNNHLFEQLERLNDEGLTDKQLEQEIIRSKAMASISTQIINNASLVLEAQKLKTEHSRVALPEMLENKNNAKRN